MISVDEALERILNSVQPLSTEPVMLSESLGRVLAETITVDRDAPPTDRSAMDGFAVRAQDIVDVPTTLSCIAEAPAGRPTGIELMPGSAIRINTGGVVPEGADAIVMKEYVDVDTSGERITIKHKPKLGDHIRRQGEDRKAGDALMSPGRTIGAPEISALATVGKAQIQVFGKPTVCVLSTGDELVTHTQTPEPHQVRNANAPMLASLFNSWGLQVTDLGQVHDDREALKQAMTEGLKADLFCLTGGVSVGEYDLVAECLEALGVSKLFHRLAMRPGKPVYVGALNSSLVFGLPGNPVSAFTAAQVLMRPVVDALQSYNPVPNYQIQARLHGEMKVKPGRRTYHLAQLFYHQSELGVRIAKTASSGDVLSIERANAFIVTESDAKPIKAGEQVTVRLWNPLDPRTRDLESTH